MPVSPFTQPDYTDNAQTGSSYPTNIDDAIAVHHQLAGAFSPQAQNTPNMTVHINAGALFVDGSYVAVAAQNTATIVAPSANPRYDLVTLDSTYGGIRVVTGVEAASPSEPTVPAGELPICAILLATSTTAITNNLIYDRRTAMVNAETLGLVIGVDVLAPNGSAAGLSGLLAQTIASQAEAEAGAENTKRMTALRVSQAIAALSSGSIALIGRYTPSTSASVDITGFSSADYDSYLIAIHNLVPATDDVELWLRTSTDGGSSFDAGASDYFYSVGGSNNTNERSEGAARIAIAPDSGSANWGVSNVAAEGGFNGEITIHRPDDTTAYTIVTWFGGHEMALAQGQAYVGWGQRRAAADVDAVQLLFESGNIVSGTVDFYGLKKA